MTGYAGSYHKGHHSDRPPLRPRASNESYIQISLVHTYIAHFIQMNISSEEKNDEKERASMRNCRDSPFFSQ